jgi:hypothetical protein
MEQQDALNPASGHAAEDQRASDQASSQGSAKGKEKTGSTFTGRIQRSANMFASSLGNAQSETNPMDGPKSSQPFTEDRNRLSRTMGETSTAATQRHGNAMSQSMRAPSDNQSAEASFTDFQKGPEMLLPGHALPLPRPDVDEQEAKDGDAVLSLLDDPSHESGILKTFRPEEVDEILTPDERARLQKALFGEPRQRTPWATLLDPTYDLVPQLEEEQTTETLFGKADTDSGRQQWLDQWRDVLTSYNDEVWGDLGPLASEAQAEVSQLLEDPIGETNQGHQALNRLRQVLAHLRG